MSTAYKRVTELLDRWQASLDLHARYLALDDAAYARVQAWPKHQRPTKWVLELARSRLVQMRGELAVRQEAGDPTFAESLELMSLLANLLGAENFERFIPLATGKANTAASGTVRRPRVKTTEEKTVAARPAAPSARPAAKPTAARATSTAPRAASKTAAAPRSAPQAAAPAPSTVVPDKVVATVVADAVRFLRWGKEWPALAPSIARLADRPAEAVVARILRAHRSLIETRFRQPPA